MLEFIEKSSQCWSKEKANEWYKSIPLPVGCNFLPSTAANSTEMWQAESFDEPTISRELKFAREYGYNCVRVFLPFIVWQNEGDEFVKRINTFLCIANSSNIKVVFCVFDDCAFSNLLPYYGKQNDPQPLTHNSCWTASPGVKLSEDICSYEMLKSYVKSVVGTYCNDNRILFWDLYNEPGNNGQGARTLYLVKKAFDWAREVKAVQPLTVGVWGVENGAATKDVYFTDALALEESDIISYHQYSNAENAKRFINTLKSFGYPIVCTEYMARVGFDCFIENILPIFKAERVGSFHWGLVNGKTQTHIPWGWDTSKGEPGVWFHDVLKQDGTPYNGKEMELIKSAVK